MDVSKLSGFDEISMGEFLMDSEFGRGLSAIKTGDVQDFRVKCRECIDRVVSLIVSSTAVTSGISRGLYSFCPEIMLEGDDLHIFELFGSLCDLLRSCRVMTPDDLNAASAEFKSYVIEKRRHHEDATCAASDIDDVISFLLRDFAFQSRVHVFRLFKLCCLFVGLPKSDPPASCTIDLGGSALKSSVLQECILMVQSHIIGPSFNARLFFSGSLLSAVRDALLNAGDFFRVTDFDVWRDFCVGDMDAFIKHYESLYCRHVLERRKECEAFYVESNKTNRSAREKQCSSSTEVGSVASSAASSRKSTNKPLVTKFVRADVPVVRPAVKGSDKGSGAASTKQSGASGSKGSKKNKKSDIGDPDVVHKLRKSSNR